MAKDASHWIYNTAVLVFKNYKQFDDLEKLLRLRTLVKKNYPGVDWKLMLTSSYVMYFRQNVEYIHLFLSSPNIGLTIVSDRACEDHCRPYEM